MVKNKDIEIKDSGYFAKKRAEKAYYSPEAREKRAKIRSEVRAEEAKSHVEEMLAEEREKRQQKKQERERLWRVEPAEEKPRIQVKEGKTAFKPEVVETPVAAEKAETVKKAAQPEQPKAVIKKAGSQATEVPLTKKQAEKRAAAEAETPVPKVVPESAKVIKKRRRATPETWAKPETIQAQIKPEETAPRPMLKTKGQPVQEYDETTLATEAVMQGVSVKSISSAPARHAMKRGTTSELDDSLPSKTYNSENQEERIFRHELKYYISEADYYLLRNSLNCLLKHDGNAGENGDYYIRSLYFDDYKNTALMDKLSGVESRRKYRIRIYGLKDDFIRLERKNKTKDYISKDNLVLSREEYDKIIDGDIEFLLKKQEQVAKDFYYEIKTKNLKPAVIVDYVREAYVHPIKNLRVTFDKVVKSGRYATSIFDPNVPLATVLPPGTVVLEIKFQKGLPDYIIGVLNTAIASQRSAISKYTLCRKFET